MSHHTNIAAYTALDNMPAYLSINRTATGMVEVTVRGMARGSTYGETVSIILSGEGWANVVHRAMQDPALYGGC